MATRIADSINANWRITLAVTTTPHRHVLILHAQPATIKKKLHFNTFTKEVNLRQSRQFLDSDLDIKLLVFLHYKRC